MDLFRKDVNNQLKEENSLLKLKCKELEDNISHLNKIIDEYKAKEQSISSAIVFAVERSNQLEDSRKKLYQLDIQRSRLLYMRMEQVLTELYNRYPELKKDSKLIDMSEKFRQAVFSQSDFSTQTAPQVQNVKEDPIRKLLNNIINYIDDEKKIKTIPRADKPNLSIIAPTTPLASENITATYYNSTPSPSGFDINEALHPSESLEEILKVFDLGKKKK